MHFPKVVESNKIKVTGREKWTQVFTLDVICNPTSVLRGSFVGKSFWNPETLFWQLVTEVAEFIFAKILIIFEGSKICLHSLKGGQTLKRFTVSFWDKSLRILCRGSEIRINVAHGIIKNQLPCKLMLGYLKVLFLFPRWYQSHGT